ncbi:MAG: hypothetical protein LBT83_07220 [Tannerella sp.]|jgi:hypothetical protein|nr:hypothetical protein [Tannerella sp.]
MKKVELKTKKGSLKRASILMALILVAPVLLTNCGSKKAASASYGDPQSSEYALTGDCALLHIYRPGAMAGALIKYDLKLGGETVFRATNKSKTTVRVTREGAHTLSARTEAATELPIDIQFGNEYYIRCGLRMGIAIGRPKIEIVDSRTGKAEFGKIPASKK